MHGNVIGLTDPKSCVEGIEAKTGARAEEAENNEAAVEVEVGDMIEDDKTVAEEIQRVTEI